MLLRAIRTFLAGSVGAACFLVPVVSAQIVTEPMPFPEGISATGDTTEVRALRAWAEKHQHRNPQQAEQVALRALALARELNDEWGMGRSLMTLGNLTPNFAQKEIYYREAQDIFERINDEQALIHNKINLGNMYNQSGFLKEALESYLSALDDFRRTEDVRGQVIALNNIGNRYLWQGDLDNAHHYFIQSVELSQPLDDRVLFVISLVNLGTVLIEQEVYAEGEALFRQALIIAEEGQLRRHEAAILNNLGVMLNRQEYHSRALPFLFAAVDLAKELEDTDILSAAYDELALAYMGLSEYDEAMSYAFESLALAQKDNQIYDQMLAYERLSQIHKVLGRHEQALGFYEQYVVVRDSIFSAERTEITAQTQARYETQEAHRAVERLEQQNQIQALQASRRQTLLLFGIVVALLVAGLFYYRYRTKQKANRLLEELDMAKSRFFANISHEFRTPLTVLLGELQDGLAGRFGSMSENLIRQHHVMLRNTRQLQGLIDEVLDLNRLESGRLELRPLPGDLVRFLQRLIETHAPLAERKGVKLAFESSIDACPRLYDAEKLEKIVGNLLSNALKFTPKGESVRVSLSCGAMTEVMVTDSGPGIPPEALDTVFERFTQLDEGARQGGTGIGLALAKELAELHRGTITVESTPGSGSTFTVRLPLEEIALSKVQDIETNLIALPELPVGGDGYGMPGVLASENGFKEDDDRTTVLLIEDNDDVRAYVRRSLEKHYRIHEAVDGESGLQQARSELPDIIVTDVMLPGISGFELVRRLKTESITECIPVVMLTARAADEDETEGYGSGAEIYLTKPFSPETLRAACARLLEERKRLRRKLQDDTKETEEKLSQTGYSTLSERAHTVVLQHLHDEDFSVGKLASALSMTRHTLYNRFISEVGLSPSDFVRTLRMERARELLMAGAGSVSEVAYAVGFNSHVGFSRAYRAHYGAPPSSHLGRENAAT